MIPAPILRFLPHILIAAAVIGGVWWFSHARYTAGYEARSAEVEAERVKAKAESERKRKEASNAFQKQDTALTDRVLRIDPGVIRVCVPAPSVRVPEAAGPVSGPTEAGGQDLSMGRDIGRDALVLATECERDRRKLIALQEWVNAQAR